MTKGDAEIAEANIQNIGTMKKLSRIVMVFSDGFKNFLMIMPIDTQKKIVHKKACIDVASL